MHWFQVTVVDSLGGSSSALANASASIAVFAGGDVVLASGVSSVVLVGTARTGGGMVVLDTSWATPNTSVAIALAAPTLSVGLGTTLSTIAVSNIPVAPGGGWWLFVFSANMSDIGVVTATVRVVSCQSTPVTWRRSQRVIVTIVSHVVVRVCVFVYPSG